MADTKDSKKRNLDLELAAELDAAEAESRSAKKPKREDTSEKDPEIIEEDIWFKSRALSTLTVHVKVFEHSRMYNKKQTHLLHLHCVPGVLAAESKWFEAIIESDPTVTDVEMPESFSYHTVRSRGDHGVCFVYYRNVIHLFRVFHRLEEINLDNHKFQIWLMLFYIDASPLLIAQIEKALVASENELSFSDNPLTALRWADYFKSEPLLDMLCNRIRKLTPSSLSFDDAMSYIKELPRDLLDKVLCKLFIKK